MLRSLVLQSSFSRGLLKKCALVGRSSTSSCSKTNLYRRWQPPHQRNYHEVSFQRVGEPINVLEYRKIGSNGTPTTTDDNDDDLIQIGMLYVPWNPADVNTVQGKYPSPLPPSQQGQGGISRGINRTSHHFEGCTVAGSEGWGRIISSSSSSSSSPDYKEGSLVSVGLPGLGTMRSTLWAPRHSILPLGERGEQLFQNVGGASGSTLFQLGGTALRMLTDFVSLSSSGGDVVIQNAGTSGVAVLASQLSQTMFQVPMVSIVRRGKRSLREYNAMINYLETVGQNSLVVEEEDLNSKTGMKDFQTLLRNLSPTHQLPRLALNAVGGPSAKALLKCLEPGGTMVTYGGMSMEPVVVGTPQLIFKNVHVVGYWHSRWMVEHCRPPNTMTGQELSNNVQQQHQDHDDDLRQVMVNDLMTAVLDHKVICPPTQVFSLAELQDAMKWHPDSEVGPRQKLVFDCREDS